MHYYFASGRGVKYCDQRVCLSVCLFVCPLFQWSHDTPCRSYYIASYIVFQVSKVIYQFNN